MTATCGRSWLSMRPATTEDDLIAAASIGRRGDRPIADPSQERIKRRPVLGGLVTNTSGLRRSPGQRRWPHSGTPQAPSRHARSRSARSASASRPAVLNGALPAATTTNGSAATASVHAAGGENSCPFSSCRWTRSSPSVPAVGDELEVLATQGMERVRHPDATVLIVRIGCS